MNTISVCLSLISLCISIVVAIFNIVNQFRNIFLIPVRNQRMRYCLSIISTFQNIEKCILDVQSDEDYLAFEILISSKSKL